MNLKFWKTFFFSLKVWSKRKNGRQQNDFISPIFLMEKKSSILSRYLKCYGPGLLKGPQWCAMAPLKTPSQGLSYWLASGFSFCVAQYLLSDHGVITNISANFGIFIQRCYIFDTNWPDYNELSKRERQMGGFVHDCLLQDFF